jgi:hypothetical protein
VHGREKREKGGNGGEAMKVAGHFESCKYGCDSNGSRAEVLCLVYV